MFDSVSTSEFVAAGLFAIAIMHTFLVSRFLALANRYPEGSVLENLFHLLGEVEVVFGFWATILIGFIALDEGPSRAVAYLNSRNFTEPVFVFVIMAVCATRPVLEVVGKLMATVGRGLELLKLNRATSEFVAVMAIGPLLGSFITEPAAMTVCALIAYEKFFVRTKSTDLRYAMIGLLFVNISIGGTLTSYAAPPVLMVANTWNWDSAFMIREFGWKAVIAIFLSTAVIAFRFRKEFAILSKSREEKVAKGVRSSLVVSMIHLGFVALIVLSAHHMSVFLGLFLLFLGVTEVTKEYQSQVKLKEGLLVGFFLAGLVVLGGMQAWWLAPIVGGLKSLSLFLGSIGLTALTDNAALTYLGSLVPGMSDESKYALVAGAVTGGGLTVIANAPNPAGYGILLPSFGPSGINPVRLLFEEIGRAHV